MARLLTEPRARAAFEAEMRDTGVDWQMHLYGRTVHNFTNRETIGRGTPDRIRYSPEADARSWASMQALLAESFG
jgi:dienelactone hydrolase